MTTDTLQKMLDIQAEFQKKYKYQPTIHELASAIMTEGGELWSLTGKWWKKTAPPNLAKEQLEESIDIFHFLMTVWLSLGLTADDVFNAYTLKMGVNIKRQETGY